MTYKRMTVRLRELVVVSTFVLALVAPSVASAEPEWDFTPELTLSSSTYSAGAHPDLTVEMNRPFSHCVVPQNPSRANPCTELYEQQNLKKMVTRFPSGLMADANAAPYCDPYAVPPYSGHPHDWWFCRNEDALIGNVLITAQWCDISEDVPKLTDWYTGCIRLGFQPPPGMDIPPGAAILQYGYVYNARPRTEGPYAGEQGHLIVLWPDFPGGGSVRTDLSVTVRESDLGIDTVADGMQDMLDDGWTGLVPGAIVQMKFTLEGSTGLDESHPLLTNPTFCDPQAVDAEFQGYAFNSRRFWLSQNYPQNENIEFAHGDGKTMEASAPYQSTDCESLPYAPTFTASADSEAPGAAAALSTTITQKDDEATTKQVHVEFPKGTGINIASTLTPCSAADLAAKSCPEVSKMGTVEAESRLLPILPPNNGPLKGSVYLTGREGNKLTLSAQLSGFINLQLNAKAGVDADGNVTATFDDLPSLPYSKFTLNLSGGSKGLITNPRACGQHKTKATFTSHSGKVHVVESASQVKGCSTAPEPEFEIDLSNDGKGKRTALELDLSARDRYIKKVKFGLPRYLKFSTKRLGKAKRFGSVSMETKRGELESSLSLSQSLRKKRKKKKAIRFSTKGALNNLKVSLFKKKIGTKKVRVRTKSGKKKTVKKSVLKSRFSFRSLPKQDIKGLRVELNPSESRFLSNPKGCKKPLRFLAFVTTSDGKKHVLSQKVKLKGKGCSKKKAKK